MKLFTLIILSLLYTISTIAQSNEQDNSSSKNAKTLVIIYDISYPNKKEPAIKSICYNKVITFINGPKINTTCFSEYGTIITMISYDRNESWFVIYPDQQFLLKRDRNEKTSIPGAFVTEKTCATNEKKHILDYECDEYIKTTEVQSRISSSKNTSYIYSCNIFKDYVMNYSNWDGITGLLLGADYDFGNGCIQRYRVKSLTEQMVDSSIFDIPANYSVLTMDELLQKMKTDRNFRKQMNKDVLATNARSKWNMFFDVLLEATPKMANLVGDIVNQSSNNNSPTSNLNISSNCDSNKQQYDKQREMTRNEIIRFTKRVTNDDIYSIAGKEYAGRPNAALNVSTLKGIQSSQNLMRTIREGAKEKGCAIYKAEEEDWRP